MEGSRVSAFKAIKRTAGFCAAAVITALLAFLIYVMVCNMQGKVARIFGNSIMKVVTGSMEPSIHEGDYILIKKTDVSELGVGDVICFYSRDSEIYGMPNTHRITAVLEDGSFVTKGDANSIADSTAVSPEDVIGRYEGKVRFLRWLNSFASGKKLLLLLVIIPMTAVAFYEVTTIARLGADCRAEKGIRIQEEKEKLFREAVEREKKKLYENGGPETEEDTDKDTEK